MPRRKKAQPEPKTKMEFANRAIREASPQNSNHLYTKEEMVEAVRIAIRDIKLEDLKASGHYKDERHAHMVAEMLGEITSKNFDANWDVFYRVFRAYLTQH